MKTTGILCVLLLAAGLFVSGAGRAQTTIRIGYALATDSHYGVGAAKFADEIAKRTGGRFKVEQFPTWTASSPLIHPKGTAPGVPDADVERYFEVYRSFPAFSEILFA